MAGSSSNSLEQQLSGREVQEKQAECCGGCCYQRTCCRICGCICVFYLIVTLIVTITWFAYSPGAREWPQDCGDGISCRTLTFSNLTYQCRFAGPGWDGQDNTISMDAGVEASNGTVKGDVILLHGFPEWSSLYNDLMRALAKEDYRSVACNQRGYSMGARPDNVADYTYNVLRDDIFAMADAAGFGKFHLIGHDHGALLGWYAAASLRGQDRLLSYNSQSIPHPGAFSKSLYGEEADVNQQVASQYFTMFILRESASLHGAFLWRAAGRFAGWDSPTEFQKPLNWYNGVFDNGLIAQPPLMSRSDIRSKGTGTMRNVAATLRWVYGGEPNDGKPAFAPETEAKLAMPVLYICGLTDAAVLCGTPVALKTKEYCTGDYTYMGADCGHDVLNGCATDEEGRKVIQGIVDFIKKSTP